MNRPPVETVEVLYRPDPDRERLISGDAARLELQGDPFDVCDAAQRRLFPKLSEDGWPRLLEHRQRVAERERAERAKEAR